MSHNAPSPTPQDVIHQKALAHNVTPIFSYILFTQSEFFISFYLNYNMIKPNNYIIIIALYERHPLHIFIIWWVERHITNNHHLTLHRLHIVWWLLQLDGDTWDSLWSLKFQFLLEEFSHFFLGADETSWVWSRITALC